MARKTKRLVMWSGAALLCAAVAAVVSGCGSSGSEASDDGPVKLGVMAMITGPGAAYGPPTVNSAKLAAKEINDAGGVLGRDLTLEFGDTGNDPKKAITAAQRLITKDRVAAMVGLIDSASRDAIIPSIERGNVPFLYAGPYEGGACNKLMYATGSVPETSQPVFKYVQEELGGDTWYMTGNDYVYSRELNDASQKFIEAAGGTVVGSDYVPIGTTDLSQILEKIRQAKPDHIFTSLVGSDLEAFIKQAYDFGITKDTTMITTGIFDSQIKGLQPAIENAYSIVEWTPVLKGTRSREFVSAYDKMFPDEPDTNALGENTYNAVKTWALAVEDAGTTDTDAVMEALAGITYEDAPRGSVTLDASSHHVAMPIYLVQAKGDKFVVTKEFEPVDPGPQCDF